MHVSLFCPCKMKNSRYGTGNNHNYDPQLDFAMFLKEARNYEYAANNTTVEQLSSFENVEQSYGEPRTKKSWKNSFLFSWLKSDKRSKHNCVEKEPSQNSSTIPTLRRGHSGPIYGNCCRTESNRLGRQNSGPLTALFNSTKRKEEQMPYICLDKLNNNSLGVETYGPVYLVT